MTPKTKEVIGLGMVAFVVAALIGCVLAIIIGG